MVPEYSILTLVVAWCYFTHLLYLDVTICHFFSSSWLHTLYSVVFAVQLFSVLIRLLDLGGSLCCVFKLRLLVYIRKKIISKFRIISKSLLRDLDILWGGIVTDIGRCDALLHIAWHWNCGLPNYLYIALDGDAALFQINLYSAWRRYWICVALDGGAASCRINLYGAWWRYWIFIALEHALQFM